MKTCHLNIADFDIRLRMEEDGYFRLPQNYHPFTSAEPKGEHLCDVSVVSQRMDDSNATPIYETEDLGFRQEVLRTPTNNYLVRTYQGNRQIAAVMKCGERFEDNIIWIAQSDDAGMAFGFNNSMMIAFAFAAAYHKTLAMHSSVVAKDGWAYMFLGKSGTGKSTHSSRWLKHLKGFHLLNDDNPVLRVKDNGVWVYGSPWSGKTPCYRQEKARVGGIVMLEQGPQNKIWKEDVPEAFASLMISCSLMIWDKPSYNMLIETMSDVIGTVGVHHLSCLPDEAAAQLSHATIAKAPKQA